MQGCAVFSLIAHPATHASSDHTVYRMARGSVKEKDEYQAITMAIHFDVGGKM